MRCARRATCCWRSSWWSSPRGSSSPRGGCGSSAAWPPSAPRATARRRGPRWPRTCTTRCFRRSRWSSAAPTTRARSRGWPAARNASCAPGSTTRRARAAPSAPRSRRRPPGAGPGPGGPYTSLRAAEVEAGHGVAVDVVAVGDAPLDEAGEAVVAAAREALVNAAKFAGGPVSVYAEADDERIEVFVRDRGPGFDLADVPGDRRGVRESILGRMERHGGRARIHTAGGGGTEVELVMERGA